MKAKTCCITGHRKIEVSKIEDVKKKIKEHIIQAIDDGYIHFISGFAEGVDLYFAKNISELKNEYNITLEAAIPYRNRMKSKDIVFKQSLKHCGSVVILAEEYSKSYFMNSNRFMVQASERVIAVYDGREKGGTLFTVRYACTLEKDIKIINI